MPIATQQFLLLQRNLIYTGITRGKQLVLVVGQKKALRMAVQNATSSRRYSGLLPRLLEGQVPEGMSQE
jgi:exodeoxyribonuclease V alpha subunit